MFGASSANAYMNSVGAAPGADPGAIAPEGGYISLFANSVPTPQIIDSYLLPMQDKSNIIYHEFYDSFALTSATAQSFQLFSAASTNLINSNMPTAGQLSNNERFFCIGIRCKMSNTDTTNPLDVVDTVQSLQAGYYNLQVGQRVYNSNLMDRFLDPEAPLVVNTKYYWARPFITYKLPMPVAIGKLINFNVNGNITAATLDATTRIYFILCGFWYQNVQ